MQPALQTSRLLLRPRTLADTQACLAMDAEPGVTRYVTGPWSDPAAHRQFIEARTIGPYAAGLGYWTIQDRNDASSFLGWVLLIPADGIREQIEIGWRLRPSVWRKGIASEAAAKVLNHAFATLGLPEVIAEIDPANLPSRRVAEKIGMALKEPTSHGSETLVCYSITSDEYARIPI